MVNIDIITGFLGSGKTTFIKKLLEADFIKKEKLVLIENEFGEVGVDGKILAKDSIELYEISKGCICCSLKGEFLINLEKIINDHQPDRILIEPSGIFVIEDLYEVLNNERIKKLCQLNSITTIVDIKFYREQLMRYSKFFDSQIRAASNLVISKMASYDENELQWTLEELRKTNEKAALVAIPFEDLTEDILSRIIENKTVNDNTITHEKEHSHGQLYNISSISIQEVRKFTEEDFENIVTRIKTDFYGQIIRIKGYIQIEKQYYLVNYVNGEYTLALCNDDENTYLCIIGDTIDKQKINNLFK